MINSNYNLILFNPHIYYIMDIKYFELLQWIISFWNRNESLWNARSFSHLKKEKREMYMSVYVTFCIKILFHHYQLLDWILCITCPFYHMIFNCVCIYIYMVITKKEDSLRIRFWDNWDPHGRPVLLMDWFIAFENKIK